jgi:hypothetical protein
MGKAFLYGTIGVLSMISALSYQQEDLTDESPQGIFLLLSGTGGTLGLVLMLVLFGCMVCYILWRIMEVIFVRTSPNLTQVPTPTRRFFRYRFSPLVSATIYTSYAVFLMDTIIKRASSVNANSCFPECWHNNTLGETGLVLLGIAFSIGALTQLEMAYSCDYLRELKPRIQQNKTSRYFMKFLGTLGHLGRTLLFGMVGITFFLLAAGKNIWTDPHHGTLGQTLNHWVMNPGGRFFLFITGFLLLLFALFVFMCVFLRSFPTHFRQQVDPS